MHREGKGLDWAGGGAASLVAPGKGLLGTYAGVSMSNTTRMVTAGAQHCPGWRAGRQPPRVLSKADPRFQLEESEPLILYYVSTYEAASDHIEH